MKIRIIFSTFWSTFPNYRSYKPPTSDDISILGGRRASAEEPKRDTGADEIGSMHSLSAARG